MGAGCNNPLNIKYCATRQSAREILRVLGYRSVNAPILSFSCVEHGCGELKITSHLDSAVDGAWTALFFDDIALGGERMLHSTKRSWSTMSPDFRGPTPTRRYTTHVPWYLFRVRIDNKPYLSTWRRRCANATGLLDSVDGAHRLERYEPSQIVGDACLSSRTTFSP